MPSVPRYGDMFGINTAVADYEVLLAAVQSIPPPVRLAYAHFDILLQCLKNDAFRDELRLCSMVYVDGVDARMAFRLLHGGPVAAINATDFHHHLLASLAARGKRIAAIGGRPDVSERLTRELVALGFAEDRVLVQHGYNQISDFQSLQEIQNFRPDAIFLGLGTPKQFEWMQQHRDAHFAELIVATGGFLDFLAGITPRAPRWMRTARIEWLHRLLQQPARLWKRYLVGIPRFVFTLLWELIRKSRQ